MVYLLITSLKKEDQYLFEKFEVNKIFLCNYQLFKKAIDVFYRENN